MDVGTTIGWAQHQAGPKAVVNLLADCREDGHDIKS